MIPVLGNDICKTFPNLAHLDIQAAQIQLITADAFHTCENLSSLKIENQRIKSLDKDVFKNLRKLYSLSLNHIGLQSIHEYTFESLTQLWSLSLTGNKLYDFKISLIKNLTEVDQLWINSNEISDFDEVELLEALPKLKEFYFNDNDLSCHRIESILYAMKERGIKGLYKKKQRTRYYKVEKIDKIECLTEEQWSNVYYKKVAQTMTKNLEELKRDITSDMVTLKEENQRLMQSIIDMKKQLIFNKN